MSISQKGKKRINKQLVYDEIAPWLKAHVENNTLHPGLCDFLKRWLLHDESVGQIAIDAELTQERTRQIIKACVARIRRDIALDKKISEAVEKLPLNMHVFNYDVLKLTGDPGQADPERIKAILLMPLADLGFSIRALNFFVSVKIITLEDILKYGKADILKFRNFGKKIFTEIEELLARLNMKWLKIEG